jgi:hypothetical protein
MINIFVSCPWYRQTNGEEVIAMVYMAVISATEHRMFDNVSDAHEYALNMSKESGIKVWIFVCAAISKVEPVKQYA